MRRENVLLEKQVEMFFFAFQLRISDERKICARYEHIVWSF